MANRAAVSARVTTNSVTRYAIASSLTAVALLAARGLSPLLGDYVPYVAVFPALAFSAWYCGPGPSAVAIVLAVAGLKYWFISPVHSFVIETANQAFAIATIVLASGSILAMGEVRRRENAALRQAQGDLEDRVKQRTGELDAANDGLRELTARLLQLQDDERRRIARELHDSVGQLLAGLTMNLSAVGADIERLIKTASMVTDSAALVHEINKEVRTISHLLHPPLLDEAGLASALRWYIEGFAERSQIQVVLDLPDDFGRLSQESETTIFRMVQESLTNIHRHSGSKLAKVRISRSDGDVRVEVEDRGKGMTPEKQV